MAHLRYHALMVVVNLIEPCAGYTLHLNPLLFCQLADLLDPSLLLRTLCDLNSEHIPAPSAESLVHCVTGVDEFFHSANSNMVEKIFILLRKAVWSTRSGS